MSKKTFIFALWAGFAALFLFLLGSVQPTNAAPISQAEPPDPNLSIADGVCLGCHGQPGQTYPLQDGSTWDLYVPQEAYSQSIHGQLGYACVQCHRDVGSYPHPAFQAADLRDAQLKLNNACKFCHTQQYELANDSVHAVALANGNREAAICVDCHTAHDVRRLNDPISHELLPDARVWIPQTCARCHSAIYDLYKESVHGAALIGEGNLDVPTCIDCHGVHNIVDPTTTAFRLSSPQMCGKCHTDSTVVGKYGLSTDVLDTYVADFHGSTVTLFEKQSPDEQTNKPVCYDCHGIHDIVRSDDPQKGLSVRQNLLVRCQECHPSASENFPESWLSHYIPSPEKYPAVFYVDLFYKFFIPGVLGGMGILVAMDFSRMGINRLRLWASQRRKSEPQPITLDSQSQPSEASSQEEVHPAIAEDQNEIPSHQVDMPPSIDNTSESGQEADLPLPSEPDNGLTGQNGLE
jgi:Zn-finger protein